MKAADLLAVSVSVRPEAEEPVAQLLERMFERAPSIYTDEKRQISRVTVYCLDPGEVSDKARRTIRESLSELEESGWPVAGARLSVKTLPRQDWAESWKKHFKPIQIGSALLVKPSWSRLRPARGQAVVVLDPGLSFGTGQHPTTAFCLEQIVQRRPLKAQQSFLDAGTGSGILAIAAAKLGYRPVRAFDVDEEAVRVARQNARLNHVGTGIQISREDLTQLPARSREKYDLVCANLTFEILLSCDRRLIPRVSPGGILVLAGVLREQFGQVRKHYQAAGLRLVGDKAGKEWWSGAFARTK